MISSERWEDAANRAKYYPKEAKKTTKLCSNGSNFSKVLPLHHACALNPTTEVTESLLDSYPKAVQKIDSLYNRLPLHVACLKVASCDVIRSLLRAYKDGAKEKMKDGQLPLHYACGSGASKEVVAELLSAYPEGARCQDMNGWLPIHLACLQNAPVDVIRLLLHVYPQSVGVKTDRGIQNRTEEEPLVMTEPQDQLMSWCGRRVICPIRCRAPI